MAGRGLRALGHPLHAVLSHFPLALLTIAPALDLLALVRPGLVAPAVSFWALAAGLAVAVPTAGAGFVDYLALDDSSPAGRAAARHIAWVLGAAALFAVALWLRGGPALPASPAALALECVAAIVLSVGGWWGGELVFRHDVGGVATK